MGTSTRSPAAEGAPPDLETVQRKVFQDGVSSLSVEERTVLLATIEASLVIKAKDTFPLIEATLETFNPATGNEEPINLTGGGVKVKLIWETPGKEKKEGTGVNTIVVAAEGKVSYKQLATDFAEVGKYLIEWVIEWEAGTGKLQHVPNEGVDVLEVQATV